MSFPIELKHEFNSIQIFSIKELNNNKEIYFNSGDKISLIE